MRADEQRAMPEGEDDRAGDIDADGHSCAGGIERVDVAVTQRGAECAYGQRGEWGNDGEQKLLLARECVHEDEFSCSR